MNKWGFKLLKNILSYLILFIIFIEILYIIINNDSLCIINLKLHNSYNVSNINYIYLILFIVIFSLLCFYLYVSYLLNIHLLLSFVFLLLTVFLYVEYKIRKNKNISHLKMDIHKVLENCNTGDIIFYDIPKIIPNIFHFIPILLFGMNHMGIVIKRNNNVYLLECAYDNNYCHYSNKIKNGVILINLKDRIIDSMNNSKNDIYFVKSNLHNQIKESDVNQFIEEYKNNNYMDDQINCVSIYLLFLQKFKLLSSEYSILPLYEEYTKILQPDFYNFDYKNEIYKITK